MRALPMVATVVIAATLGGVTPVAYCQDILIPAGAPFKQPGEDQIRAREVVVDGGALWSGAVVGGAVRLRVFDDAEVVLVLENRWESATGFSVAGRTDGIASGTFSLAVEQGQVSAGIWTGTAFYGLAPTGRQDPAGRGVSIARQLTPAAAVRCAMAPGVRPVSRDDVPGMRAIGQGSLATPPPAAFASRAPGGSPPSGACDCADDQSRVDVLFVYTPAALSGAGGLAALTARIQDAIAQANQSYINSAVTAGGPVHRLTIGLAGVQPIAYDEVSPQWLDHLDRVASPTDGFMDGVHAQRNTFNADVVSLVVDDPRFTGGAAFYAVYSDTSAFSVLNWRAMGSGSLTLAHELGHTFGCAHDRGNSTFAPFRYAWGYSFAANATTYGTIMSYTGAVPVASFSNPVLTHAPSGQPLGTPLSSPLATDNALTIRTTHWTIASYRDAPGIKDCNGNGIDDATDIASGTSLDLNGNCRPDECEQRIYVDASNTGAVDGLSWNTAWPSLADALAFASMKCSNVSEVWVAGGTYKPDAGGATDSAASRYATFNMRSGLAVIGGFQGKNRPGGGETSIAQRTLGAYPSILSGDIGVPGVDTDNSFNVVSATNTNSTAILDGFTVQRGYQDYDGGGMYALDSSVTVRNCVFRNNRGGGGAAFTASGSASSPTLTGCTFLSNTAVGAGGSIGSREGASVTVEGSSISGCNATYGGAAFAYFGGGLTFRNCTLEDNTAQVNSGAVDCYSGSTLTMEGCIVRNNHALGGGGGAAIVHTDCTGSFTSCQITGNSASGTGGAVWTDHSQTAVQGCTIQANTAGDSGGALSAYGQSTLSVNASTLRGNTARWGGAISSNDSTLDLRRCTLETNQATQYSGGAVDLYHNTSTIVNTVMRANAAADGGGGINLGEASTLAAANCTIYANSAVNWGGGIGVYLATLNLNNSILYANTATNTPGLLDKQLTLFSGSRTVNRSCVQGLSGQLGGSGNTGANPALTNPAGGDVTLTIASPCIDAGSNALVPAGTTLDRAGNPRFANVPSVPDTGVGTAPIVDMGAFEFPGPPPCPADIGVQGGAPGSDGHLDNNDFIVFIDYFFNHNPAADLGVQGGINGQDGVFDNNDFVVFIDLFFSGC